MKKFFNDLKHYKSYILYATKANLKAEVASSYLNWLWWILDPLLFMLVYSFVALVVFGKGEPFFPLYVFIGLNTWNFFSKTVNKSVRMIRSYKGIISKVYIPKYVLILITIMENLFKMTVAYSLILIMIPIYRVPISWYLFNIIPLFITLIVFTFGCSCLMLHAGVYLSDLSNIIKVVLKLAFYMSGIFFNIKRNVPKPYSTYLLRINPMAFLINGFRDSLLYSHMIEYGILFIIFVIGCIISVIGIRTIINHENNYVKVI
ncbi:polysaccharide ABC transporter [Lachnospiraceae bacterium 66-29]